MILTIGGITKREAFAQKIINTVNSEFQKLKPINRARAPYI